MSPDPRITPAEVTLEGQESLRVRWADGHETALPLPLLRRHCPCAKCRTAREKGGLPFVPGSPPARLEILEVVPVGYYALRIRWSDEHRSGIYPYPLLRSLCGCAGCRAAERPAGPGRPS